MRPTSNCSPTFWFQSFAFSVFNNTIRQMSVEWLLVKLSNEISQCKGYEILKVSLWRLYHFFLSNFIYFSAFYSSSTHGQGYPNKFNMLKLVFSKTSV